MRAALFVLLSLLLASHLNGQFQRGSKCACVGMPDKTLKFADIKSFEVFQAAQSCTRQEIVVTMKSSSKTKCVDPARRLGKYLLNLSRKSPDNVTQSAV